MLAWSLETQADQRNTRATLYDVGVGSEGEFWRLVGVTVPARNSVHGIFQMRILEWVAISCSRGSLRPRDPT